MNKYKISIIVPCYNVSGYVKNNMNSIKLAIKKGANIEPIFINDKSTDDTAKIIEENLDNNFIFISNKKNVGVSEARNIGIEKSTGDYIFFLDGDDVLSDDFSNLIKVIDGSPYYKCGSKRRIRIRNNYMKSLQPSTYIVKRDIIHKNDIKQIPGIIFEDNHYMAMLVDSLEKSGIKKAKPINGGLHYYTSGREGSIMNSSHSFDEFKNSFEEMKKLNLSIRNKNTYAFQLWNSFWSHAQNESELIEKKDIPRLKKYLKKEFVIFRFWKIPILYKLRYISFKLTGKINF